MSRINLLDEWSDSRDLSLAEWEERYTLDMSLQHILTDEEIQWQRRGGDKWLLQGNSNCNYVHKCANGRKRKMQVTMLKIDGQEEIDPNCLKDHITDYYKQLFGRAKVAQMPLDPDLWPIN
jgi:hypothetical protein